MSGGRLQVLLLGPVRLLRDGQPVALPRSRKVLALLAYLALERGPQARSRLCDLLWDGPNDPRGELRWCLSKLRSLVDDTGRSRVLASGNDQVALDLSDVLFDAAEVERLPLTGLDAVSSEGLAAALAHFRGDFLEGTELDAAPQLSTWLEARRHTFRALRVAVARELALRPSSDAHEARQRVEAWLALEPFEARAHEAWLRQLLHARRARDGEEHLARTIRAFEREGIDWAPLRAWWREAVKASAAAALSGGDAAALSGGDPAVRATAAEPARPLLASRTGRASVAVMPFSEANAALPSDATAHGLSDDIITRLAKLRSLFVIARGTTYALGERGADPREAGRILGVDYVVSGRIRRDSARSLVNVELAAASDARIIWTDELGCDGEATFSTLDTIVDRVVAVIAKEIEAAECQRALLAPPGSLDAWQAYHRGLWHMYKFRPFDNGEAAKLFQLATRLDPTFSRAYAGLSFTHFQNVFLELTADREQQIALALSSAAQSLAADDRDPAAHWAMGRAEWLRGAQRESIRELSRSIELSPNFALGHYTMGFIQAQSGDPHEAIRASNTSRELSPFDPLQFGMLGSRALAHLRLGELEEGADWALAAIGRPNAHVHILAIAVCALGLARRSAEASELVARIRQHASSYDVERFLRAFRFDRDTEQLLRQGARAVGF
jgi:TolB-like protein/DNA-binding SARP family transcriptional activator